jgi:1-acyl-sn-glycerol-3-phosphate acyltransferase
VFARAARPEPGGRQPAIGYRVVRAVLRGIVNVFYGRVEVAGAERLPDRGPLIVAANHHNALFDPMLLIATLPRRLTPVAKATLFAHPLLGVALRLMGAVPVHRRQESTDDPARNAAMFAVATRTLGGGGAILIFPEGISHDDPRLAALRTGTARMLLAAAAAGVEGIHLVPIGLVYDEPGTFRTGRALVAVGRAVPADDCVGLYRTAPTMAVRQLTDRLTVALREQMVEADDRYTLRLLRVMESVWRDDPDEPGADGAARMAWMQQVMRAYRHLLREAPGRVVQVRRELEAYAADLARAGVTSHQLSGSYSAGAALRRALGDGLVLLLGAPPAALGMAAHVVPYRCVGWIVRLLRPEEDVQATYKIVASGVVFPLFWILEGWVMWRVTGGWGLALFLGLLVPTAWWALAWQERWERLRAEVGGLGRLLLHRDLHRHLRDRRQQLADTLSALAALVPESVRLGSDAR